MRVHNFGRALLESRRMTGILDPKYAGLQHWIRKNFLHPSIEGEVKTLSTVIGCSKLERHCSTTKVLNRRGDFTRDLCRPL